MLNVIGRASFMVAWFLACTIDASASCPEKTSSNQTNPVAYEDRGDRCEGLFRQQVAASAQLTLLGFHAHQPKLTTGSGKPLIVSSGLKGSGKNLSFRALSSKSRQYYRMDATFSSDARFVWKRDVIDHSSVKMTAADLKGLLCSGSCSAVEPTIIPVSIAEAKTRKDDGVTIWFRAGVDLKELYVTVESTTGKNAPLKDVEILDGRVLPAGAPKDVVAALKPGSYRLRAVAVPVGDNAMDQVRAQIIIP